jgi:hypothetical protein
VGVSDRKTEASAQRSDHEVDRSPQIRQVERAVALAIFIESAGSHQNQAAGAVFLAEFQGLGCQALVLIHFYRLVHFYGRDLAALADHSRKCRIRAEARFHPVEKRPRRMEHVRRHHGDHAHTQRNRGIHGRKIDDHDIGLERPEARAQTRQQTGGMHQSMPVPDDVQLGEPGLERPDANFRIGRLRLVLDEHVARTKKENPHLVGSRTRDLKCSQHFPDVF